MADNNLLFLLSSSIGVFPCGNRSTTHDPHAGLNTEYNFVSIINRLVDRKSFCVTNNIPQGSDTTTFDFIFNINGYLFTWKGCTKEKLKDFLGDKDHLYACILVGPNPPGSGITPPPYTELLYINRGDLNDTLLDTNQDTKSTTDDKFKGLALVSSDTLIPYESEKIDNGWSLKADDYNLGITIPLDCILYVLPIVEKQTNEELEVPRCSLIKFATTQWGRHLSVAIDDGIIG